jgi:probable HAF family extracellular repeat protein
MSHLIRVSALTAALIGIAAVSAAAAPAPPYIAVDVGTLGGPNAYPNEPGRIVSDNGTVVGSAETPALNPFTQECNGCHATDAFQWRSGVMTDLGTLGGYNAGIFELNDKGVGAGFSETGALDPLTNFPEVHAVMSSNGRLTNLGTLGGNESWASAINNRGQIAGLASNAVADPFAQDMTNIGLAPYPSATQWHAAVWQDGKIVDLGTLGGPDSVSNLMNNRGQVAGESFTNSTVNNATGMPTLDPFVWRKGVMRDLGGLGGTFGIVNWINSHGEVAGFSDLAGDQSGHPFLWDGRQIVDLGTLGGDNGAANWVSEHGDVAGTANTAGNQNHHAFLWRHGHMTDLPPVDGATCSNGLFVGDDGLVVGNVTDCRGNELDAVMWQNGTAYNLNNQIAPTDLHLITAEYVNDRGEIFTRAVLPNGDQRIVLLVPRTLAASEEVHPSPDVAMADDAATSMHERRARKHLTTPSRCTSESWRVRADC